MPETIPVRPRDPFSNPTVINTAVSANIPTTANHYVNVNASAAGVIITALSGKSHTVTNTGLTPFALATNGNSNATVNPGQGFVVAWVGATGTHSRWAVGSGAGGTSLSTNDVRAYGALGNDNGTGTTGQDDTTFIQAAINDGGAYLPGSTKFYKVSATLTNPNAVPIVCEGTIIYTGTSGHGITVGQSGTQTFGNYGVMSAYRIRRATRNWAQGGCGVLVQNVSEFMMSIGLASEWKVGAKFIGNAGACAYGTVYLGQFYNDNWSVEIETSGTGYCNQITWIGGRMTTQDSTDFGTSPIGGFHLIAENNSWLDGHTFINPNFEFFTTNATGNTYCFYGDTTTQATVFFRNRIVGFRQEETDFLVGGKGITDNVFEAAYFHYLPKSTDKVVNGITSADTLKMIQGNTFDLTQKAGNPEWRELVCFTRKQFTTISGAITSPARGAFLSTSGGFAASLAGGSLNASSVVISGFAFVGVVIDLGRTINSLYRKVRACVSLTTPLGGTIGGRFVCKPWSYNETTGIASVLSSDNDCAFGSWDGALNARHNGNDASADFSSIEIACSSNVRFLFVGFGRAGSVNAEFTRFSVMIPNESESSLMMDGAFLDVLAGSAQSVAMLDSDNARSHVVPSNPTSGTSKGTKVLNTLATNGGVLIDHWTWNGTSWEEKL